MPWSASLNKLFRAAAHNPDIAKRKGITQAQAATMAAEGVKPDPKKLGKALKNRQS